ncbi:MAG: NAD(P)-dependent glycerol-3-phosphate dehydrogenase [Ignavibacteria bacterium]|nr:NAD(P)-dependent glycerol-3-phosphate dehydrogenase [Ignavibacteria bacterium]
MTMRIGIIGAGAWGTALASVAAENGHSIQLWAREPEVVHAITTTRSNEAFLPGSVLADSITATNTIRDLVGCEIILNATPTQHVRSTLIDEVVRGAIVVNVAKGIEIGTHLRVSEIVAQVAPSMTSYAVLSGPSHAEEVILRMPTTVVCASSDLNIARTVQTAFSTPAFRVYASDDVIGVEICGSLKNVIAIAAGIVDGLGLGDNTKAALITRGLAEMSRLGVALGADQLTFFGLAGLGDLYVTCASRHSRNRSVGEQIGKGASLTEILSSMNAIAEGVTTTKAALELAATVGIELPITQKVAQILFDGVDPRVAIRELMLRPNKSE